MIRRACRKHKNAHESSVSDPLEDLGVEGHDATDYKGKGCEDINRIRPARYLCCALLDTVTNLRNSVRQGIS